MIVVFGIAAVGIIVWALVRAEAMLRTSLAHRGRELDLKEREIAVTERMRAEPVDVEPIPPDLIGLALAESETWAQDQMLKMMRETFQDTHDWNAVRRAIGRTTIPTPEGLH